MNEKKLEKEEEFLQREILEYIDAKPKKRIIKNKAMRCSFRNAMAEIVDNCLDYWADIERPHELTIDMEIQNPQDDDSDVTVEWNMGVPRERWRPLLTPGDAMHRTSTSIGVWGEGFKISAFATGKVIDIMTNVKGTKNQIHIASDFMDKDDWIIPVYKDVESGVDIPEDHTLLRLTGKAYNDRPLDVYPLKKYLGETFGTRMRMEEENGYKVVIRVNGEEVEPKTFGLPRDIAKNFSFPPDFEPSIHVIHEGGLKIRLLIGLLHTMDSENYGVYMYGNGRLFASRLRNEVVGFGTRANSPIPADHPHAKRIQVHVFFEGSPDKIPWQAPLKDSIIVQHPIVDKVAEQIKKYALPYALYMKSAKTPEIVRFSRKWNEWDEERRMKEIFTKPEKRDISVDELGEKWKSLSEPVKGDFEMPKFIDTWDHGTSGKGRKPNETAKFDKKLARKVLKNFKDRDTGKISSGEIITGLIDRSLGIEKSKGGTLVPTSAGEDNGEDGQLFDLSEGSVTLSVRMHAKDANDLAYIAGGKGKSELLKKVIEGYKEMQTLKSHPVLLKKKKVWNDDELVEEVRRLLDRETAEQ